MPSIQLGDKHLHVHERGKGTPLLLVHGFPLDHSMWQGQIEDLSKSFRVLAPDLRGFGTSTVTPGTVTMEQHADDLARLLEALAIREPVVFCGLSMGGYVAWQFALKHRPRLTRLILCDTRAIADSPEVAKGRLTTADRVLKEGAGVVAESMLGKLFAPQTIEAKPALVEKTKQVMLKTPPEGIAAALRGMAQRPDVTPRLAELDLPALVICGEHDAISTPQEMRGIAENLPDAKFVEIKNAGHMSPLEQPPAVNAAIREFLKH
jgi:pimeloyl-ACP methyl ester carboxylesterase